jgi:Yersinia/Haemophilus virulence surface antigen
MRVTSADEIVTKTPVAKALYLRQIPSASLRRKSSLVRIEDMPSAGHSDNLGPNLETVAGLNGKIGAKLSYNKETGRFSIQEAGKLQSLARTFSRDSIEEEEYFGAPIRELFAAARAQGLEVSRALGGLKSLRNSYPASFPAGEKRRILDAVIEDAELGVWKEERARGISLRRNYAEYVIFGFAQEMFLPESEAGVCYSFTVHWARRILMGKTSFGVSKKGKFEGYSTLSHFQKERIMRKVDRIRPLHAALKEYIRVPRKGVNAPGDAVMQLVKEPDGPFWEYGDIEVGNAMARPQNITADARGSDVIEAVLVEAEKRPRNYTIFLVNFGKAEKRGHTIGIHLESTALHFFDPNCGEFALPKASKVDRKPFLDDWWQAFYMVSGRAGFDKVKLEGVKLALTVLD